MSGGRWSMVFLVGTAVLSAGLWLLRVRERTADTDRAGLTLCPFSPDRVDRILLRRGGAEVELAADGTAWRIVRPFPSPAEKPAVARLLDFMCLRPAEDMRSESDLEEMGENASDFGFDAPEAEVTLCSRGKRKEVRFGSATASGKERFAKVDGSRSVFAVPAKDVEELPDGVDAFRPRLVLDCPRDEIAGLDFRAPDQTAVRIERVASEWRFAAPASGLADSDAVDALADGICKARAAAFELPTAARPPASDDARIPAGNLAPYGLSPDVGFTVTVRSASGTSEQIVFGKAAGTNMVWALVRGGTTVVKLPSATAEMFRRGVESLRDTRVFPMVEGETLKSVSFTAGGLVYVLSRGDDGKWGLQAPVVAPADADAAEALVGTVMKLRQSDLPEDGAAGRTVQVSISTTAGSRPGVKVPEKKFGTLSSFADLRAKTMLVVDPGAVRRIAVREGDGEETAARWDAERSAWNLELRADGARPDLRLSPEAVKRALAAVARVEASGVETVAAAPEDLRRCGLHRPAYTLSVDVESAGIGRINLLVGGTAPGGGRYATVGGGDAVFIVSKRTVAELCAPLATQKEKR